MDHIKEYTQFKYYSNIYGGPYGAVAAISRSARKLSEQYNNTLRHSESISHIITHTPVNTEDLYDRMQHCDDSKLHLVSDIMDHVDNIAIKWCVIESISDSLKCHHLIYRYHNILDENVRSRIRILVRMIWGNIILRKDGQ